MRALLLLCALLTGSCFPQLPDPLVLDELRTLAVQVSPASALLSSYPLPTVTVIALTVDPDEPEGLETTHSWAVELGDEDFDGRDRLESLVPQGSTGPVLELDFSSSFAREETNWVLGRLPLKYVADNGQLVRETIKIVNFLSPELQAAGDDDDSSAGGPPFGDDDDSSAPVGFPDPGAGDVPTVELPEDWNANPTITLIERVGGETWSIEQETLPGPTAPLYVGEVSPDVGLHLRIELVDDQPTSLLSVEMFRTTGLAGLPDPEASSEEESQDSTANFGNGGSPVLDDELIPREFGWTPFQTPNNRVVRLFLIVRDREGGQTWQELRPLKAPDKR